MEGQNEPMQEGEARAILEKLSHMRAAIKGIVPPAPGLKRGSRHLKLFGGLTLRDALSLQLEIMPIPLRPLETVPARRAADIVRVGAIDDHAHGDLSLKPLSYQ